MELSISPQIASLTGTLEVQLNKGYAPAPGSSFTVLSNGTTISGSFNNFNYVPPAVICQPVYGSSTLTLVAYPPIALFGTNVVINVVGTPGREALLLTTTNLTVPLSYWTRLASNRVDVTRFLSFTNGVNFSNSLQFFTCSQCATGFVAQSCLAMLSAGCIWTINAAGQFVGYDCNDEAYLWLLFTGPNGTGCPLSPVNGGTCNSYHQLLR